MPRRNLPSPPRVSPVPPSTPVPGDDLLWDEWLRQTRHPTLDAYRTLTEAQRTLVGAGADPEFVAQVLTRLTQDPILRRLPRLVQKLGISWAECDQRITAIRDEILTPLQDIEMFQSSRGFAKMSVGLQCQVLQELRSWMTRLIECIKPFREAQQCVEATDPLLILLERAGPYKPRRGPPSQAVASLFMALLTDHLRERTGTPHYTKVGRVAQAVFPGCLRVQPRKDRNSPTSPPHRRADPAHAREGATIPADRLWRMVYERCKAFKQDYDLTALWAVITTPVQP